MAFAATALLFLGGGCTDTETTTLLVPQTGGDTTHTVYFSSNRSGHWEIYAKRDTVDTRLTANPAYDSWLPRLSPDGSTILFYRIGVGTKLTDYTRTELWTMARNGTAARRLLAPGDNNWIAEWGADWSPDGTHLVIAALDRRSRHWNLFVTDPTAHGPVQITTRDGRYTDPAYSPDGTRIVCVATPPGAPTTMADFEVTVLNADGSNEQRLTVDSLIDATPAWSPDGRTIVFVSEGDSTQNGPVVLRTVRPDGTGLAVLLDDGSVNVQPRWSQNGDRLYVHHLDAQFPFYRICRMLPDGTNLDYVTTSMSTSFQDIDADPDPRGR